MQANHNDWCVRYLYWNVSTLVLFVGRLVVSFWHLVGRCSISFVFRFLTLLLLCAVVIYLPICWWRCHILYHLWNCYYILLILSYLIKFLSLSLSLSLSLFLCYLISDWFQYWSWYNVWKSWRCCASCKMANRWYINWWIIWCTGAYSRYWVFLMLMMMMSKEICIHRKKFFFVIINL